MKTVQKSKASDSRFKELAEASYKKVFNLAYRLAGNRSDAEDLTQEAFYRAYRKFDSFEGDKPFENWIFRIVTRLFLDLRRSRSRRVQTYSYDAPIRSDAHDDGVTFDSADDRPNPEEALMDSTLSPEMEMGLSKLPAEQRQLIWMADVEGIPYNEIAVAIKAPVGTVRSRLHRAHKHLRKIIEQIRANPAPVGYLG